MKTIHTTLIAAALLVVAFATGTFAQTVSRTYIMKPAGSINTLTLDVNGAIGTSYSLLLPGAGNVAGSPIMKVSTGSGNKTVSFGQIDLTSNTALTGDITGILRAENGGTGIATPTAGSLVYGNNAAAMSQLAIGSAGQELRVNAGGTAPVWVNSISNQTFTYTVTGTETGFGSGFVHFNTTATPGDATIPAAVSYAAASKLQLTLTTSTSGAQSQSISNRTATGFDVYTAALSAGDVITISVIN